MTATTSATRLAKQTDTASAHGGFRQSRRIHNRQFTRNSRRWLRSIGERNPLFLNEGYAATSTVGTLVAHPLWLFSAADTIVTRGHPELHAMLAAVDWRFDRWVRVGDRVSPMSRMTEQRETTSSFAGSVILQTGETMFLGSDGRSLATARTTTARFSREEAVARGKYTKDREPYRYSQEDLFRIEDGYDHETVRGARARWWEDVEIGDALDPVVKGPLTSEDMLEFIGATRPAPAYGRFDDQLEHEPGAGFLDDCGIREAWTASLIDASVAARIGLPGPHDAGMDRISWLGSLLTNWMGDDGFLSRFAVRLIRPVHLMDAVWCTGEVRDKHNSRGSKYVVCSVRAHNQRGELTAEGTAEVELPGRDGFHPLRSGR
ncbi:FAS1-like dehydratase domain-containing protein [Actinophytocola sp.]|uniref:FAS1-like dehydratase domain-containing protein n=1 Tax=Actinophytocola sp. TaxID=1872138 RepID=UPI003D6B3D4F